MRVLVCSECCVDSNSSPGPWRAVRCDEPEYGEPPMLAFFCAACAEREFGEGG